MKLKLTAPLATVLISFILWNDWALIHQIHRDFITDNYYLYGDEDGSGIAEFSIGDIDQNNNQSRASSSIAATIEAVHNSSISTAITGAISSSTKKTSVTRLPPSKNLTATINAKSRHEQSKHQQEYSLNATRAHPHAGARHPNGTYGYVIDVTAMKKRKEKNLSPRNSLQKNTETNPTLMALGDVDYEYVCNTPAGKGVEGKGGWDLLKKVEVGYTNSDSTTTKEEETSEPTDESEKLPPKVLCGVYTYEKHHETMVQAIVDTWAHKCDGFFAASTTTNASLSTVDIPHEGDESYENMWQKTRSILAYMHDNYLDDFDYFWLGGDDVLLIVENVVNMLQKDFHRKLIQDIIETTEQQEEKVEENEEQIRNEDVPLFLGSQVPFHSWYFCHGGPGYILNRMALKKLMEILPTCAAEVRTGAEDRTLSMCLKKIGILCGDTADENGQQRFLGAHPNFFATFEGDGHRFWTPTYKFWAEKHGGELKKGAGLISEQTAAFHRLNQPRFLKRIYAILYPGTCPNHSSVGQALKNETSFGTAL